MRPMMLSSASKRRLRKLLEAFDELVGLLRREVKKDEDHEAQTRKTRAIVSRC